MMMDELCAMDASSRIRLSPCHYTTLLDLPDTGPVRSRRTACLLKAMALLLLVAGAVGHHTLHSSPPLATHALMSHALPVQPPLALGTTPPAAATGTRLSRPLLRSPHAPGRHSALDPLYIASRDDPDAFRPLSSAGLSRVLWGVGLVLCGFFLVIRGSRWAMATFTSEQFPNQGPKWRRTRKYYPELPLAPGEHSWRRSYFFRKRMKWTDPGMIAYEYRGIKCRHCGLRLYEPGPFTKQEIGQGTFRLLDLGVMLNEAITKKVPIVDDQLRIHNTTFQLQACSEEPGLELPPPPRATWTCDGPRMSEGLQVKVPRPLMWKDFWEGEEEDTKYRGLPSDWIPAKKVKYTAGLPKPGGMWG